MVLWRELHAMLVGFWYAVSNSLCLMWVGLLQGMLARMWRQGKLSCASCRCLSHRSAHSTTSSSRSGKSRQRVLLRSQAGMRTRPRPHLCSLIRPSSMQAVQLCVKQVTSQQAAPCGRLCTVGIACIKVFAQACSSAACAQQAPLAPHFTDNLMLAALALLCLPSCLMLPKACRTCIQGPAAVPGQSTACKSAMDWLDVDRNADLAVCADGASAAAAPMQMPMLPSAPTSQPAATPSASAASSSAELDKGSDKHRDAEPPAPELQTPPKNGKRRRGGRVSK